MKILFVYPGTIIREVPLNIMYVSSSVKEKGHKTRLFHFTPYSKPGSKDTAKLIEEAFLKEMNGFKPDIVGFSVMVQNYNITKCLSGIAKNEFNTPVIWGGIQPVLEPEECISEPSVDYICTGEGEVVFPRFLEALEKGESPLGLPGIWGKDKDGKIIRSERSRLIEDLDSLPFPDRELLPPKYYKAELTGANILTARGCPFPCSYCQNKRLMEIYKGKGKFVRYRSPENVFKEMEEIIAEYDSPSFYFSDEMFTLDKKRAIEFCREYKKKIARPFMVQTRVDYMDDELAKALKDAGCFMVNMAIENGNEDMRRDILNKTVTDKQIFASYKAVHDAGMMTTSFNMIGVPGETMKTIWETININRKLTPHRILCTIFMPLPGTELYDKCKKENLIDESITDTTNYYSQVVMKNKNISPRTLIGYQGFFDWYVLLPRYLYPFVHLLRIIYQSIVSPKISKNPVKRRIREIIVEFVYQLKRFLPQKKFHVKNR
ncbi:MAG: radical SAM protein [Armatimonadota bacterium]